MSMLPGEAADGGSPPRDLRFFYHASPLRDVCDQQVVEALRRTTARVDPEFLQPLPHVHGTAGFFVARLIVR